MKFSLCILGIVSIFVRGVESIDNEPSLKRQKFDKWQKGVNEATSADTTSADVANLPILQFRGGDANCSSTSATCTHTVNIEELISRFGSEFKAALDLNVKEHKEDCAKSCENFYCGDSSSDQSIPSYPVLEYDSYSMGSVPPEDFANDFSFPLDLIKVTRPEAPLIGAEEAKEIVRIAEAEGVLNGEYISGKYKLGGDWLDNLPSTRAWFNEKLESVIFPEITSLFPEVVSSPSVLRAHSVALLRYNSSHPRTDIHVDNGILAMTIALSPREDYEGGGTFFEHLGINNTVEMEVGGATFRPGSVRHGGNKVKSGVRFILGGFLLIEDRVEHVRRLKNRGAKFRREGKFEEAKKSFEWALAMSPKCCTCMKDLAELHMHQGDLASSERVLREAIELIPNDSDALFSLGVLLSEMGGRDEESVEAYMSSAEINSDDHELMYNLAMKFGERKDVSREREYYAKCVDIKPEYGPAWLNWGTSLAETGELDDAVVKFGSAINKGGLAVRIKASVNLGLVENMRANNVAVGGDLAAAEKTLREGVKGLRMMLEEGVGGGEGFDAELVEYVKTGKGLLLKMQTMLGQVLVGEKKMEEAEKVFRALTIEFPKEKMAWMGLGRLLDMMGGDAGEIEKIKKRVMELG